MRLKDFMPESAVCLLEGYSKESFFKDLFAGITVGVIALPLALAFAIASGVAPEKGLFTAIVAGFIISLLGGSRVQIGGPTGAYVVLVYAVMQKFGYEGLALATLIAGVMIFLMGLARLGNLIKYIPYPVVTGFTTGIAFVIVTSQIKDFFGLSGQNIPPEFIEKCKTLCQIAHTWNLWAVAISFSTLVLIFTLRRYFPRVPGTIIAIILATVATYLFNLPLETIESKFGGIPSVLPTPSLPHFSYDLFVKVFPDALTIALLGAVESLLSAVVADGMTGGKHRSNVELIAQGLANIGSVIFGGIPATGAIARTSANVKMGAKSPLAGMLHAITLLLLMMFFAPLAAKIPLAALAGVLLFVAWNMSELPHFIGLIKGQKGDAAICVITFLLTVLIDLAVAVQVGVLLAAILFLKNMTDKTTIEECTKTQIPGVAVFEIKGPFFYTIAERLEKLFEQGSLPEVVILRIHQTPLIDSTGLKALKKFEIQCRQKEIKLMISDVDHHLSLFHKSGFAEAIGKHHLFSDIHAALAYVKNKQ